LDSAGNQTPVATEDLA